MARETPDRFAMSSRDQDRAIRSSLIRWARRAEALSNILDFVVSTCLSALLAMNILEATEDDLPAILESYNEAVANTTAIWNEVTVDLQNRLEWFRQRKQLGYPVFVSRDHEEVTIGFATFGDWRAWDGYRYTVEHSIYVQAVQRGNGVGNLLLSALINRAKELEKHVMVAGIEASNEASIKLHLRHGFEETGRMREVGAKF